MSGSMALRRLSSWLQRSTRPAGGAMLSRAAAASHRWNSSSSGSTVSAKVIKERFERLLEFERLDAGILDARRQLTQPDMPAGYADVADEALATGQPKQHDLVWKINPANNQPLVERHMRDAYYNFRAVIGSRGEAGGLARSAFVRVLEQFENGQDEEVKGAAACKMMWKAINIARIRHLDLVKGLTLRIATGFINHGSPHLAATLIERADDVRIWPTMHEWPALVRLLVAEGHVAEAARVLAARPLSTTCVQLRPSRALMRLVLDAAAAAGDAGAAASVMLAWDYDVAGPSTYSRDGPVLREDAGKAHPGQLSPDDLAAAEAAIAEGDLVPEQERDRRTMARCILGSLRAHPVDPLDRSEELVARLAVRAQAVNQLLEGLEPLPGLFENDDDNDGDAEEEAAEDPAKTAVTGMRAVPNWARQAIRRGSPLDSATATARFQFDQWLEAVDGLQLELAAAVGEGALDARSDRWVVLHRAVDARRCLVEGLDPSDPVNQVEEQKWVSQVEELIRLEQELGVEPAAPAEAEDEQEAEQEAEEAKPQDA